MIIQELKKLKLQEEMISISRMYGNSDLTGVIEFVNDEIIILREYDADGSFGGFSLFETDQIIETYWGHRRQNSISFLAAKTHEKNKINLENHNFKEVFFELASKFSCIGIYCDQGEENYIIGEIVEFDNGWIKLDCFGDTRSLSRSLTLIRAEDILRAKVDSPYQNNLVELHGQSL